MSRRGPGNLLTTMKRRHGADIEEDLGVHPRDKGTVSSIDEEHARSHDGSERRAGFAKRLVDDLQGT
jgi:hypothetical protein